METPAVSPNDWKPPEGYTLVNPDEWKPPAGYTLVTPGSTPQVESSIRYLTTPDYQSKEQPYNFPKPTYKSSLPWPLNRMDEAVDDSINWMADGVMRAMKAKTVDEKLAGVSETLRGFFNTAGAPLVLQALPEAPLKTALGLAMGVGTQKGIETVAPKLGAGPGTTMAAADVGGIAAGMFGPKAIETVGPPVGRFVAAAAPDVAMGTLKAGTGAATASVVPGAGKWFVGEYLTRPGRRQIVQGIKAGVAAAKSAPEVAAEPAPAVPPAAAPVAAKTAGQVYAESEGHDWASLSATHKQLMEQIAQAHANVAAQPPPPATPTPSPEPPVTPPAAPQAAPAAPEAPAATPEPPVAPVVPEAPQTQVPAAQAAAQALEEMMRVEQLTDYAVRKKIPPAMMAEFGPEEWKMIADDARTQVPTADQIAQIKQNVAAQEVSTPVQGERVFTEQKARGEAGMTPPKQTPPAAPPAAGVMLKPGQTPAQALAEMLPESAGPPPAAGPAAATASETRVEALAQHFAKETEITPEAIRSIAGNSDAAGLLTKLSDSLGIKGRPAPGEIEKIANRVGELRQAQQPAAAPEAAAAASQEQVNALHAERIRHEAEMERRYGPGWRQAAKGKP